MRVPINHIVVGDRVRRNLGDIDELAESMRSLGAYRRGETIGQLRWRAGGHKPEAFPEPE